jgi:hypothetical protein
MRALTAIGADGWVTYTEEAGTQYTVPLRMAVE